MTVFLWLLQILGILGAFYGGIIVGIADCKKRFNVPKGATGVDDDGYNFS